MGWRGAAHAQRNAIDEAEALALIAERMRQAGVKPGTAQAVDVLTTTMSTLYFEDLPGVGWWYEAGRQLLTAAGADPEKAYAQARPPKAFQVGDGGQRSA